MKRTFKSMAKEIKKMEDIQELTSRYCHLFELPPSWGEEVCVAFHKAFKLPAKGEVA